MSVRIKNHPILDFTERKKISFTFDGKPMEAYEGEPIAAALYANGIFVFRKTPKKNEPRSLFCGIGQCNDCVVIVNKVPNVRSCVTLLEEGMEIETQAGHGKVGILI